MTSRQYEHLGRAMLLAASLARSVEGLRDLRSSLSRALCALIGSEAADAVDGQIMRDMTPSFKLGDILNSITEEVERSVQKEMK